MLSIASGGIVRHYTEADLGQFVEIDLRPEPPQVVEVQRLETLRKETKEKRK